MALLSPVESIIVNVQILDELTLPEIRGVTGTIVVMEFAGLSVPDLFLMAGLWLVGPGFIPRGLGGQPVIAILFKSSQEDLWGQVSIQLNMLYH